MPFEFIQIPANGRGGAKEELNKLLRGGRIASVRKEFVPNGEDSFWAFCIRPEQRDQQEMNAMLDELEQDLTTRHAERRVRSLVVKLKFSDFRRTTAERAHPEMDREIYKALLAEADSRSDGKPARLLGVGVRFHHIAGAEQMELFDSLDTGGSAV